MKKLTSLQFSLCDLLVSSAIMVYMCDENKASKKCSGFKKTLPKPSGVESELDGVGDTGVLQFGDLSGDCTSEKKG